MRLKLTGKHSTRVEEHKEGTACLTLTKRALITALHTVGEGGGSCWVWPEGNEELHNVRHRHRGTQVLSMKKTKERWLSDWDKWGGGLTTASSIHVTPSLSSIPIAGSLSGCLPFWVVPKPLSSTSFHECQDVELKVLQIKWEAFSVILHLMKEQGNYMERISMVSRWPGLSFYIPRPSIHSGEGGALLISSCYIITVHSDIITSWHCLREKIHP